MGMSNHIKNFEDFDLESKVNEPQKKSLLK
jgi:hypothetical protein